MSFTQVKIETKGPYFIVKHKVFQVPIVDYTQVVNSFVDPFQIEAVQEYVSNYLVWAGDPGLVGLVGATKKNGIIIIDAAVRYEVDN